MADKILSLESIKKCLEKVKNKIEKCIRMNYVNEIDFNTEFSPGFFNIPYRNSTSNSPDGILFEYGTAVNICVPEKNGIAQLAFGRNKTTSFAARWGVTSGTEYNIATNPWLYFHGSTSPNIPVLKTYKIDEITTNTSGVYMTYSTHPTIYKNIIVLRAYAKPNENESHYSFTAIYDSVAQLAGFQVNVGPEAAKDKTIKNLTIDYLEIPFGYKIPEATTVSSDEPEDDEELAPQSYNMSETKQFHGENLYE